MPFPPGPVHPHRPSTRGVVVVVAALVSALHAQTPPTFERDTRIVPIYATVRGEDGHLVPGLGREAFEILDDGRPVPIAVFSNDRLPITVTALLDVSGGFFSVAKYEQVRAAMLAFVDALGPADRARIGTFSEREIALGAHLTSDKPELARVLREEFWPGFGGRPLWNAIGDAMIAMDDEPGRRVVLVLTDGPNTARMPGRPDLRLVESRAASGGFMVYALTFAEAPFIRGHDGFSRDNDPRVLDRLTTRTGGGQFAAPVGPHLTAALVHVAEELRHQYSIGFVPGHDDGKVHGIEVRMTVPGVTARARTEYIAAPRGPAGR